VQKNHIYTSGASGTNAAVIRGALRAEKPELLTVILPQSLSKQPPESQELLAKVFFFLFSLCSLKFQTCILVPEKFYITLFWSLLWVLLGQRYGQKVKTIVGVGGNVVMLMDILW
jgi:hypothetical protein